MNKPADSDHRNSGQTRRQFLQRVGEVGGVAAVYQAMVTMGLLMPGEARAADSRMRWQAAKSRWASNHRPTVAVIGGGIAGLVAAWELKQAGFPFFLLEARDRPGGRNHTLRRGSIVAETGGSQTCNFDRGDELYFNAGPARISHHHVNLLRYCRRLGVPLETFVNDNRAAWMQSASAFGGQRVRAREVIASLRGAIAELLAKAINTGALDSDIAVGERAQVLAVLRDFGDLGSNFLYDGSTRAGLQSGSGGLSPDAPKAPLDWRELFGHPQLPFHASFVENWNQSATMLQPVGGMDRIAAALAAEVQGETFYNVEVTALRRSGSRVRIEGRTPEISGAVEADYAIVTVPPPVLRGIANDFSAPVRNALNQVEMARPTKIAFQASRFWEREEDIYGGISWTDPDILQLWYPSGGFGQDQGILVGSYLFGGASADRFAGLSPAGRINLALAAGARLHPGYGERLSRGISVAWSRVPFSLGGWANSAPAADLMRPDGPFLFAGDHLSYLRGWQEGAVISALHALGLLAEVPV